MTISTSKIFLVNSTSKSLTTLTETKYEKEDHLQEFLAQYPDLLPGDQISDPACRWLFISREMPVSDGEAVGRWSLDHLFVDQDSIPTFVECKRSSDTRGRREVVAQMLDYAANGVDYWSTDQIREAAAKTCKDAGITLEQALMTLLELDTSSSPSEAIETFWNRLADNLQSRRIRLIFVADEIPRELRKLVEFMNEEMANVEVLAIEVKQYLEPDNLHKVLVPRVIGATARAQVTKQAGGRGKRTIISEKQFYEELAGSSSQKIADELQQFMDKRLSTIGVVPSFGSSSLNLRWFPESTKKMNFGSIRKTGKVDTDPSNWVPGQIGRPDIGERYQEALAVIVEGRVLKAPNGTGFTLRVVGDDGSVVTLGKLLTKKDQWFDLIVKTQDELSKAV